MSDPFVVVDADVLGRRRTGDETYVAGLLHALPDAADGLRLAALTRRPELVPAGIEPVELRSRVQELRMAVRLPLLLRRLRPALVHFVHALPPALPCPGVLTVQDLSFERDASLMGRRETAIFRAVVPRSAARARRVFAISERTKRDLVELYGLPPEKVVVTPLAHDPAFSPAAEPPVRVSGPVEGARGNRELPPREAEPYLLLVGAIEPRKDPLAAAEAAAHVGLPLVSVGPEKDAALAEAFGARGFTVETEDELVELYRRAACLLFPTRYEGFGLPVAEALATGTPVVATPDAAVREVGGDAIVYAQPDEFADAVRRVLAERDRWARAALERARLFSWDETARRTVAVYREVLGA